MSRSGAITPKPAPVGVVTPTRASAFVANNLRYNRLAVAVMGDSKAEGVGASTRSSRWVDLLRDGLRAAHPVPGGDKGVGYVPCLYAHGTIQPAPLVSGKRDDTGAGDWSFIIDQGGLGMRAVQLNNAFASVTFPVASAASIRVHWTQAADWWPGEFRVVVDGSTLATIDAVGNGVASKWTDFDFPGVAPRSVRIEWVSGAPRIEGVTYRTSKASGVTVIDASHSGFRADHYATAGAMNAQAIASYNPGVVIVALGANDMGGKGGVPIPATDWANSLVSVVDTVSAACPNAAIVLLHAAMRVEDASSASAKDYPGKLAEFLQAARTALGNRSNVAILTEDDLWRPTSSGADPIGWLADNVHPSNFGHRQIADYLLGVLG